MLRERVFYGQLIDDADELTLLGGQNWSLLTMFNHGMRARDEQVPLSIDAQYIPGFNWTRNTQIRLVKGFDHGRYNVGVSVENPQQVIAVGSGGQYLPAGATSGTYQNAGVNVNNPSTNYSTDIAPDIIGKLAADPGWGHYELTGLLRFAHSRVSYTGTGQSSTKVAGGGGGGLILPVEKSHKIFFQASGLVGTGIGRYGTSNIPDVTIDQKGQVKPMPAANVLVGLYGNATKRFSSTPMAVWKCCVRVPISTLAASITVMATRFTALVAAISKAVLPARVRPASIVWFRARLVSGGPICTATTARCASAPNTPTPMFPRSAAWGEPRTPTTIWCSCRCVTCRSSKIGFV
ncbi:hypothetical protein [Asaia platycodi]|uniref:hypothetical protein n=1 Tax=Asaia platycodi TaxID=610243 RepID=UPI000B251E02|nr:hypothetical protein [Asaia platycodi]